MNRRNFLGSLSTAIAAFTVLPSAVTYGRTWIKPTTSNLYTVDELSRFNKLPFYLADLQMIKFPEWAIWQRFTNEKIVWEPNMGSTMRGIRVS